jgi:DNA-3-methyladenine glycosylase I
MKKGKAMSVTKKAAAPVQRCRWASNEWNIPYHDREWGVPVHDDQVLFEFLILEGAQAGLSWDTILRKRDRYREAFDKFDARRIARYDAKKIRSLLKDPGIVRNRLKVTATISNARAFLKVQEEFGSFDAYIWKFVGGKPFRFIGSTICYAFMQAIGMVNDHAITCFRYNSMK